MLDLFTNLCDYGDTLNVRVTPKAASNRIKLEHSAEGVLLIRAYVTVAPESGKANTAVIKLLSKELGIPPSRLEIIKGHKIRDKVVKIT